MTPHFSHLTGPSSQTSATPKPMPAAISLRMSGTCKAPTRGSLKALRSTIVPISNGIKLLSRPLLRIRSSGCGFGRTIAISHSYSVKSSASVSPFHYSSHH